MKFVWFPIKNKVSLLILAALIVSIIFISSPPEIPNDELLLRDISMKTEVFRLQYTDWKKPQPEFLISSLNRNTKGNPWTQASDDIILFQCPAYDSSESVTRLMKALRADTATARALYDRRYKTYIIGALGRLKAHKAVPMLEALYKQENNKQSLLAISIAWALEQITGREYGPDYDPWMQAKLG